MSYPMYFPPAPFDLNAAIRAGSLVDTAYDMYAQWQAQHKPRPEAFVWKPNSDLDLQFSASLWGEDRRLLLLASREPFAFVAWSAAGEVFLVFRGSESAEDWAVNVSAEQVDYALAPGYGRAHDGFYRVYSSMSAAVLAAVADGCARAGGAPALTVAGHSLGSALSTLAVPDLLAHLPMPLAATRISHYNLASPRTGDADFAAAYDANGVPTYRVVNAFDLVPAARAGPAYGCVHPRGAA